MRVYLCIFYDTLMSQRIYKKNNARKGATGAQYQLSELELPTKRPRGLAPPSPSNHTSVLADIIYSIEMVITVDLHLFDVIARTDIPTIILDLLFTLSSGILFWSCLRRHTYAWP